ncbi:hypothetical protein G7Y89_g15043 [Cudoniella acicularis]|uniref:Uncharacterized protein n=1 Tax=Cudoniella acicularis TaxID=354080 RepID=A0A8H4QVI7_9HELO|nr:hypothetical protein G7Y89_g15043 [Cudoniella acicularis]
MADAEEKAKAEKIAAAKKRLEQRLKQQKKKTGAKKEEKPDPTAAESSKAEDAPKSPGEQASQNAPVDDAEPTEDGESKNAEEIVSELSVTPSHGRKGQLQVPCLPTLGFHPSGETAPDIYRKQATRIDELERENRRLAKEASDGEKRWKKAEEELEDLRDAEDDSASKSRELSSGVESAEESEKLIAALQRQNTQLQAQSSRVSRHGSSPSVAMNAPAEYEAVLASKSSTIESMEIEISNLRAHLDKVNSGASAKEQITALEEKLARSEKAAVVAQRELGDLKKNLDRTTEKAVKEGSERISAETKLRTLVREAEEAKLQNEELQKKIEALEKKVSTLATLHKEHDARSQIQKKEREKAEKEASDLRSRLAGIENENLRLREERERARKRDAQGIDDEGVDELENEERQRLEKKVRDLEGEVHELRRGMSI